MRPTRKRTLRTFGLAVLVAVMACVIGCTSAEEKRARMQSEITQLYNDYIEDLTSLSEPEILAKCDEAIEKFPELAIAYELKGLVYWEEAELEPAWENYHKALELTPFDEDTLANAREVAMQWNGTFIRVDDNGKLELLPFREIYLDEYKQCTEGLRFQVCRIGLGIGAAVKRKILSEHQTQTYVFVDRNGNEIEGMDKMTFGFSFAGNASAADLDHWLIQEARSTPDKTLGDVLWRFTAEKLNYGRIN